MERGGKTALLYCLNLPKRVDPFLDTRSRFSFPPSVESFCCSFLMRLR